MPRTVGVAVSHAAFHFDKLYTYAVMPDQQDQLVDHKGNDENVQQVGDDGAGLKNISEQLLPVVLNTLYKLRQMYSLLACPVGRCAAHGGIGITENYTTNRSENKPFFRFSEAVPPRAPRCPASRP